VGAYSYTSVLTSLVQRLGGRSAYRDHDGRERKRSPGKRFIVVVGGGDDEVSGYSWHCNDCDPSDRDSDWHLD